PGAPREAIALERRSWGAVGCDRQAVVRAHREAATKLCARLDLDALCPGTIDIVICAERPDPARADRGQGIGAGRAGDEVDQVAAVAAIPGDIDKAPRVTQAHADLVGFCA